MLPALALKASVENMNRVQQLCINPQWHAKTTQNIQMPSQQASHKNGQQKLRCPHSKEKETSIISSLQLSLKHKVIGTAYCWQQAQVIKSKAVLPRKMLQALSHKKVQVANMDNFLQDVTIYYYADLTCVSNRTSALLQLCTNLTYIHRKVRKG